MIFSGMTKSSRRAFLTTIGLSVFATRSAFAKHLLSTPAMTEGPFYPDKLPLDTDNDLIINNGSSTPALGEITNLTGRVLDSEGNAIRNAVIEIWQCDANAVYINTRDSDQKQDQRDKNFQGYGRFKVGEDGGYRFRTIKPVPYPGRPAGHIHYKITSNGRPLLTSQIFVAGFAGNERDGVFNGVRDAIDRELVTTAFTPVKDSKELAARFDVIVGTTPDDEKLKRQAANNAR
jgi:protocatechuate 3,4-dioxygenase, beta subunit